MFDKNGFIDKLFSRNCRDDAFAVEKTERQGYSAVVAGVVELVDTQVSDACGGNPVEVQVLSSATNGSISICSKGLRSTIVSFLSDPVEIISIGTPANFSTYSK